MALAAIELNDVAAGVARDGALLVQSPGYALIEQGTLLVGEDARHQARLKPRLISTRFWERLSNDPVFPAASISATFADLARAHLSQLWASAGQGVDGLVLVVPSSFRSKQLGLLLGIAEQLSLPVRGMVDSALVACAPPAEEDFAVHVDIHLHRAVITGVEMHHRARRTFHESLEGLGLIELYDVWIKHIAACFVRTTRFDPLHRAQSEQAIYDRLPHWLSLLETHESIAVEMASTDGSVHAIRLTRSQMADCASELYARLAVQILSSRGSRTFSLQLAHGAAHLPGLAVALAESANQAELLLPPGAGALGALRHAARITDGGWRNTLILSLARDDLAGQAATERNS